MNIFIFAANWYNRGDEAAIRAFIDELKLKYPACKMRIQFNQDVENIPYDDIEIIGRVKKPYHITNPLDFLLYKITVWTGGKVCIYKGLRDSVESIKWADIAVLAPGGPTIGEIYQQYQLLDIMKIMKGLYTPYFIYAPSMGPFNRKKKYIKNTINGSVKVCFRESISQSYFRQISPNTETLVTLDSAFQHQPNKMYYELVDKQIAVMSFISKYKYVIGITITDLQWHSKYQNSDVKNNIRSSFTKVISYLNENGYGIIFIPQLFGQENDYLYMKSYMNENSFIVDDSFDCYFQQVLISKLHAVIGMRYHSNIFSAKMGIPFISIAYEQKMLGFMEKANLEQYCIDIAQLNENTLIDRFELLIKNYDEYKLYLLNKSLNWIEMSKKTTELLCKEIDKL